MYTVHCILYMVHYIQFLRVPLNGPEVMYSLGSDRFRRSLWKFTEVLCLLEPRVIFGSEMMSKQQKSLFPCLIFILEFRKAHVVDDRSCTIFFAWFDGKGVEGVVFLMEANKPFFYHRRLISSAKMEPTECRINVLVNIATA